MPMTLIYQLFLLKLSTKGLWNLNIYQVQRCTFIQHLMFIQAKEEFPLEFL